MKSDWNPSVSASSTKPYADWDNADNWSPEGLPTDIAVFAQALQTHISFSDSANSTVDSIEFSEDADSYTLLFGSAKQPALTLGGAGIFNHSSSQQRFIIAARSSGFHDPQMVFTQSATAGNKDMYYRVGPVSKADYGGGVLSFQQHSNAGSALFSVWTGAGVPPKKGSTVGGEVAFSDTSSAANAKFVIYGTLGSDGDTFGNVVFHDNATAANATFENVGGTVSKGDGGNTQFYGLSTAALAVFHNKGGTHASANGGDVAFDAQANAGNGIFYNYAASAAGAYGGVTSFNNNKPYVDAPQAASAASGKFINYGARDGELGGGGHTSFSARYGSPTAAQANIDNYGSTLADKSSAGHTQFSVTLPSNYFPTAGQSIIHNHPGVKEGCAAGYTSFAMYTSDSSTTDPNAQVPTAGKATIVNRGGYAKNATGGYTVFSNSTTAGEATLIAQGGVHGGYGGKIAFYDNACGGNAHIVLEGNGELELGYHTGPVTVGTLSLTGGIISVQLGENTTGLVVSGVLNLNKKTDFSFWVKGSQSIAADTPYTLLVAPNLLPQHVDLFSGNSVNNLKPTFSIADNTLQVRFSE
ncbi:hypothetical protein [Aliiglaciecola sp. M165]|uniref:hypothetical protein n=1 Tax=Aliiglaciecola sp. M165 TaxID=2593649 RepID=UPI00117F3266|nr:hypothetical protein [Aliiglaciecola sp. M165]TRY33201.1 hypothetical protein FM019_04245 [Aliiglaciecola sp. M165]